MSSKISHRFRRWTHSVLRVILNVMLATSIALVIHTLFRSRPKSEKEIDGDFQLGVQDTVGRPTTVEIEDLSPQLDANATLWQVMLQDPSLQGYVNLNMPFSDIQGHLDNASEIYTVYAPINSAFEGSLRHPVDPPDFYYKFISLNHMGPNNVSYEDLKASTTTANFINHDVYFKNLQRISTKSKNGSMVMNHIANYVGRPLQAINGFVHHIDSLLYLPNGVADLLRSDPDLQTFHAGLTDTDVAVTINDTQTHLTQTVFAPTNEAFKRLGARASRFLFSPLGKTYLVALLQYHVVMNSTLFTDVYFEPDNSGQRKMNVSSKAVELRTLLPHRNLTATIIYNQYGRQTIQLNGEVVVSRPDLIMMDGVVHQIDRVLLPPRLTKEGSQEYHLPIPESSVINSFFFKWFWSWGRHDDSNIGVLELMDRLQPYLSN